MTAGSKQINFTVQTTADYSGQEVIYHKNPSFETSMTNFIKSGLSLHTFKLFHEILTPSSYSDHIFDIRLVKR